MHRSDVMGDRSTVGENVSVEYVEKLCIEINMFSKRTERMQQVLRPGMINPQHILPIKCGNKS